MPTITDPMTVDAMPTKELFIYMLTRDINLAPAIVDLADNCVDGAKRLRGEHSFKGLWVRIEVTTEHFKISDNCGGISVEVARKYAFRFGRAPGAPFLKHSVGQFGVGMKRAVFKLGRAFRVESATESTRFAVSVNVDNWAKQTAWEFEFSDAQENIKVPPDERGSLIEVTSLRDDVCTTFALASFEIELKEELQAKLQDPISHGLAITLNQIPIHIEPLQLLSDPRLAPAFKKLDFPDRNRKTVTVKLYCGLGENADPAAAGWHIFCNGRLILEADQTEVSGWGQRSDGVRIPGFHGQFNHLRGYAYFDCDDAGRLPWNTTKTGINTDSAVYRTARLEMMAMMRPVVDFLNKLKEEKERSQGDEIGPLERIVASSNASTVRQVRTRPLFLLPKVKPRGAKTGPEVQKIQYEKPVSKVEAVKKALRARSFKEVGEKTFDYFYKIEVE